jgi:hypothetical protein
MSIAEKTQDNAIIVMLALISGLTTIIFYHFSGIEMKEIAEVVTVMGLTCGIWIASRRLTATENRVKAMLSGQDLDRLHQAAEMIMSDSLQKRHAGLSMIETLAKYLKDREGETPVYDKSALIDLVKNSIPKSDNNTPDQEYRGRCLEALSVLNSCNISSSSKIILPEGEYAGAKVNYEQNKYHQKFSNISFKKVKLIKCKINIKSVDNCDIPDELLGKHFEVGNDQCEEVSQGG